MEGFCFDLAFTFQREDCCCFACEELEKEGLTTLMIKQGAPVFSALFLACFLLLVVVLVLFIFTGAAKDQVFCYHTKSCRVLVHARRKARLHVTKLTLDRRQLFEL